jgi:arylsulfatase A-like enzyme
MATVWAVLATLQFCPTITAASPPAKRAASKPPNVILFLADDLGYGDLGSYGHPVHRTPNIDRLATQGQRWTSFYAAAPVCTPSRGSLLTGRLPARLGLEGSAGAPNVFFPFSTGGLPLEEVTIAELLGSAGYSTALIGKWHLGFLPQFSPNAQGFDYFFGTLGSNDMEPVNPADPDLFTKTPNEADWDVALYRNASVVERPLRQDSLTVRYTEEAVGFLRRNRAKPFFLMVSYNAPHVPLFPSPRFSGHSLAGRYADVVEEMDWSVGRVMATLKDLKLDDNTLVIFTSDNGPMDLFGSYGGSAGPLRGGKGTTWEGGVRVPGIFWSPTLVKTGVVYGIGSQLDLFSTIADIARRSVPRERPLDGQSLRATLSSGNPSPRDTLSYFRDGSIYAMRVGAIKAHWVTEGAYGAGGPRAQHDPPLFFDLSQDVSERNPLEALSPELRRRVLEERRREEQFVLPAPSQLIKGVPQGSSGP